MVYLKGWEQSLYPLLQCLSSLWTSFLALESWYNKALDFFYFLDLKIKGKTTKAIVANKQSNNTFLLNAGMFIYTQHHNVSKTGNISIQWPAIFKLWCYCYRIKTCLPHEPYFSATAFLPLMSMACFEERCGLPSDFRTRTARFLTTNWWILQFSVSESESSQSTPGPYTRVEGFAYRFRSQFTALATVRALP